MPRHAKQVFLDNAKHVSSNFISPTLFTIVVTQIGNLMCLFQVYFVQDTNDPDWKIVVDVEPRARRVTKDSSDERLTAPGRSDATVNLCRGSSSNERGGDFVSEAVRDVDIAHVLANEERDDKAAHAEMDFDDAQNGDVDNHDDPEEESQHPVLIPGFFGHF